MDGEQRAKILIVEDDLLLSMVEERLVNNLGFNVVGKAVTGEEAIQKAADLNPDVIIMDISLKGSMNGIDAMKEIRKTSQVPVIYLSGSSDENSLEQAKETNYSGFLIKPVTKGDLEAPLIKALNEGQSGSEENLRTIDSD
ncbi:response regulator [Fodinibius salsisoli]|uniref:Response regulator n=1 Tax=Fodinibius salsisoli TaxID=2820877 RepID=A0ABT3PLX3_9BACT|nr:response regulator [Fodinibius salsisoli]MCW9706950.1 response regulator [Fodinibius salsisoli]